MAATMGPGTVLSSRYPVVENESKDSCSYRSYILLEGAGKYKS